MRLVHLVIADAPRTECGKLRSDRDIFFTSTKSAVTCQACLDNLDEG